MKSWSVRQDQQLKITALLAFSNLLRTACIERRGRHAQYTDETFDATCEEYDASRYITWYSNMLGTDPALIRVYITALGNTGSLSALPTLLSLADDTSLSPYLRATTVFAMKYLALHRPARTLPGLLRLYHDVGQPVPVRVAAVSLLFYAKPELTVLQRVAVMTWYDPSLAVAGFVRSSLASLANSQDPRFSEL
jgi:HEAT repeat protein